MSKYHILIVEDDEDIQQLVSFNLIKAGFHVSCVNNGEDGLRLLEKEKIDAVLLDLMLPGKNGLEICRQIRASEAFSSMPVIMLTAKREEAEIIAGLEHGADDYITKPFSPKVLVARVKAALRRTEKSSTSDLESEKSISVKGLQIFPGRHEIFVDDQKIALTITEFAIIALLANRPGWAFSRQQIIDAVRGYDYMVTPRMIDVQVFNLRKKMGAAGKNIETVRGIGYRLKD
ncbi:MAG: response regulator transcription factor [Proteobacteria bacterium]|nr:response regulator transcription factor [Pseudomonadota bacterium]MBU1714247.1 response regulator transcription factor [Pseudomonadota bacterium]